MRQYLDQLVVRDRAGEVIRSLQVFLKHFPERLEAFESWRQTLVGLVMPEDRARFAVWRERCRHYGLLERDAPGRLGRALLGEGAGEGQEPEEVLAGAGLGGGLRDSLLLERALGVAISDLANDLKNDRRCEDGIGRLCTCLMTGDALGYPSLAEALAEGLLLPFADRGPRPETEKALKELFFTTLGDPRIYPAAGWTSVSARPKEIFLRWLVRASIELFLRVIGKTAFSGHWSYRDRFWRPYLEEGHILDAWVALGRDARKRLSKEEEGLRGFGMLEGAQADQSVLLLRVGHLVFVEWSHSGACRAWSMNRPGFPRLYQPTYSAPALRRWSSFSISHQQSARGYWQQKLDQYIRDSTGITVSRSRRRW